VLDPAEFIPERVELALDQLGLQIRAEGVDWGESQITPQMVRQAEGETSSDGHRQGVQIRIPIRVKEEGEVSLAEAAHKLQQKVGTIQDFGGWIRRDFDEGGGFAGWVGYKILRHTLSISGLQGWLFAHRRDAPDVVVTATRWPIGYRPSELTSDVVTTTSGSRHLELTEDPSLGSAKGLWQGEITNEGPDDFRGVIVSRECHFAPSDLGDPTAQMHYLAKDLTVMGGASAETVSGVLCVQHTALTAGWTAILGSYITGEGHMSHLGPRPMWMRIYDPASEPGGVQLQLLSRSLGASRWAKDAPIISTPVAKGWIPVFLGSPRPQGAVLGEDRWEWKLMARAPSGSGAIRIRDVYPTSIEQYAVAREVFEAPAADSQQTKAPKKVEDASGIGTVAWTNPGNAKASDDTRAVASLTAFSVTHWLKATEFGFALDEDITLSSLAVLVERRQGPGGGGVGAHISDFSDCIRIVRGNQVKTPRASGFGQWTEADQLAIFELGIGSLTVAEINSPEFGVAIAAQCQANVTSPLSAEVDRVGLAVYFTDAEGEDRVCFSGRSVVFSSAGVFRQHRTEDDVWGQLVPDGFLPYVPSGGLEARPVRTIIIPSTGDLTTLPDGATTPTFKAVARRQDGHLFAGEAS
jgi:hypothetical protein